MHPSGVAKSSTSFGWGKGCNVTSAGWQVTLCDPIWYMSSSSGVATSVSELLYPCYFTLLYPVTADVPTDLFRIAVQSEPVDVVDSPDGRDSTRRPDAERVEVTRMCAVADDERARHAGAQSSTGTCR